MNNNATASEGLFLSDKKKLEAQQLSSTSPDAKDSKPKLEPNHNYKPPSKYVTRGYDCFLWIMMSIFDCFFREIRTRGAFRIPRGRTPVCGEEANAGGEGEYTTGEDPIIFIGAPHANQFIDPVILMGRVKKAVNRRVSFLIAEKSLRRPAIGRFAKILMSIGVARPQDNLKTVESGTVKIDPTNNLKLIGDENCDFTKFQTKGLIGLPNSLGSSNIEKVISKNELLLRKEFKMNKTEISKLLTQGTKIKYADAIDQSEVYEKVFEHLHHGQCIGIFPEGGSHDRPHLLPLKPGVAIMALGAMAKYNKLNVKLVCCGMNYFNAHKFRSRAIVEFGYPIEISKELLEKYKNPATMKDAVQELMEQITQGLKSVTINCSDYETLMAVQATRRLYLGNMKNKMPLNVVIEMNRRLVQGYEVFKDDERIIRLKKNVLQYNSELTNLNLPDHLVGTIDQYNNWFKNILILIVRSFKIFVLLVLSLPGYIMFSPVFILAKKISSEKAKEALANSTVKIKANDVIATWKILISMGFAPVLYCFWSILLSHVCCSKYEAKYGDANVVSKIKLFPLFYIACCIVTYCALIFDYGVESFKSLRPIYLLMKNPKGIESLKKKREVLSIEITDLVNDLGSQIFDDFDYKKIKEEYYTDDLDESLGQTNPLLRKNDDDDLGAISGYESDGMSMLNSDYTSISHIPIFSERSRSCSVVSLKSQQSSPDSLSSTFEIIDHQSMDVPADEELVDYQEKGKTSSLLSKKILKNVRSNRKTEK